jgi:hypothetical protein
LKKAALLPPFIWSTKNRQNTGQPVQFRQGNRMEDLSPSGMRSPAKNHRHVLRPSLEGRIARFANAGLLFRSRDPDFRDEGI